MYAEPGLMLPFAQGFPQLLSGGDQHLLSLPVYEDLVSMNLPPDAPSNIGNLFQTSAISEYDMGGDGDLFNAPKPILEESFISLDPVAAAIYSGYGSTITEQTLEISDMESIPNEDLLNEVFNDCKNDLLAKSTMGVATLQESDNTVAAVQTEESVEGKDTSFADGPLQKSISFGCLSSGDCANISSVKPCLLGLHEMNLEAALGMRRAYSEGDIQVRIKSLQDLSYLEVNTEGTKPHREILGINNSVHGNMNSFPSFELLATIEDVKIEDKIEERRKKLSRYRKKRTKRNYGRKIKYACRKALADSQPRIRGRFAKMEDRHANTGQCEEAK